MFLTKVRRNITARDDYEKIAREIRFDAYKAALSGRQSCPTVMFGHHEGDVEENVLTNMVKGCSILGLAGEFVDYRVFCFCFVFCAIACLHDTYHIIRCDTVFLEIYWNLIIMDFVCLFTAFKMFVLEFQ